MKELKTIAIFPGVDSLDELCLIAVILTTGEIFHSQKDSSSCLVGMTVPADAENMLKN